MVLEAGRFGIGGDVESGLVSGTDRSGKGDGQDGDGDKEGLDWCGGYCKLFNLRYRS